MECNRFVEEKIGQTESADFREHLAGCSGCARDVEELREVRTLYKAASTEKYLRGIPRVRRSRASWIPMAAAAAVLIGVFALILAGPGTNSPKPTETESKSAIFVRIHLEPWPSDVRVTTALDDCWQRLEQLEKNP
ncbi:MAG TPA: hypothetical protein VE981_23975 [Planctomycetota bacterium]|nr:hypothetical protein [Planctomycetota bacterium]